MVEIGHKRKGLDACDPSPSLTLTHTQIYMYCVWHGWIIQLFLFLAILKLSLNYLHTRYSSLVVVITLPFVLMIIYRRSGNGTYQHIFSLIPKLSC